MSLVEQTHIKPLYPPPFATLAGWDDWSREPLVTAATRERLLALAQRHPLPAQTVCLETRLKKGDERIDLAFCLMPGRGNFDALIRECGAAGQSLAWRRCLAFLTSWEQGRGGLATVPFVCLALDVLSESALPCLSVCVEPHFFLRRLELAAGQLRPRPSVQCTSASSSSVEQLVADCHQAAYATPLPEAARLGLLRCLKSGDVEARHVSFMLAREPAAIKLDVRLPVAALESFSHQIGWGDSGERLTAQLREWMPWSRHLQLNLMLHPTPAPYLEVEVLAEPGEATPAERSTLLQRLVAAGLSDPDKARILTDFAERPWLMDATGRKLVSSWYIKLQFRDGRFTEAKAYLAFIPRLTQPRWSHLSTPPTSTEKPPAE